MKRYRVTGYNRDGDGETTSIHTSKSKALAEARGLIRAFKGVFSKLHTAVTSVTIWTINDQGRDTSFVAEISAKNPQARRSR